MVENAPLSDNLISYHLDRTVSDRTNEHRGPGVTTSLQPKAYAIWKRENNNWSADTAQSALCTCSLRV